MNCLYIRDVIFSFMYGRIFFSVNSFFSACRYLVWTASSYLIRALSISTPWYLCDSTFDRVAPTRLTEMLVFLNTNMRLVFSQEPLSCYLSQYRGHYAGVTLSSAYMMILALVFSVVCNIRLLTYTIVGQAQNHVELRMWCLFQKINKMGSVISEQ